MRKKSKCNYPKCENIGTAKSPLRKGLCNKHRKWRDKGIIDENLNLIKKEPKQKEYYNCKMQGCISKHKAKGFCNKHYVSYRNKRIDIKGNRLFLRSSHERCKVINCKRESRFIRGFCKYHYQKFLRSQIDQDGFEIKNNEKFHRIYKNKKELQ